MKKLLLKKRVLLLFACLIVIQGTVRAQRQKVWLDADTGNETDDVYAIVRLINEPTVDLMGLSSAHFNNSDLLVYENWNQYSTRKINTVKISQHLNEAILRLSGRSRIDHPLGADRSMGRAWGGYHPRDSEAARHIIAAVKSLLPREKLHVLCLGALTNIASAISIDTTIAKHIECYLLGTKYDVKNGYWNKNEFNIRNDLNAFDYLLNNPSVQLTIMPVTTAEPFKFERDSLYGLFNSTNPLLRYMKQRWIETNPDDLVRTLWDLALVEAYLTPSCATLKSVTTPPENLPRTIRIYSALNNVEMTYSFIYSIERLKKNVK